MKWLDKIIQSTPWYKKRKAAEEESARAIKQAEIAMAYGMGHTLTKQSLNKLYTSGMPNTQKVMSHIAQNAQHMGRTTGRRRNAVPSILTYDKRYTDPRFLTAFEKKVQTTALDGVDVDHHPAYQFCEEVFDYFETHPLVTEVVDGRLDATYDGVLWAHMIIHVEAHEKTMNKVLGPWLYEHREEGRFLKIVEADGERKCKSDLTRMYAVYLKVDH